MAYTNHCTPRFTLWNFNEGMICVRDDANNVYVTMETWDNDPGSTRFDWVMDLQRHDGTKMVTIATRTGWISDVSKSERTFTDVLKPGKNTRVRVRFINGSPTVRGDDKTVYTGTWIR